MGTRDNAVLSKQLISFVAPQTFGHLYSYCKDTAYHMNTNGQILETKEIELKVRPQLQQPYIADLYADFTIVTLNGQNYLLDIENVCAVNGLKCKVVYTMPPI